MTEYKLDLVAEVFGLIGRDPQLFIAVDALRRGSEGFKSMGEFLEQKVQLISTKLENMRDSQVPCGGTFFVAQKRIVELCNEKINELNLEHMINYIKPLKKIEEAYITNKSEKSVSADLAELFACRTTLSCKQQKLASELRRLNDTLFGFDKNW